MKVNNSRAERQTNAYKKKQQEYLQKQQEERKELEVQNIKTFGVFFLFSGLHLLLLFTIVLDSMLPTIPLTVFYIIGTVIVAYVLKKRQIEYYNWKAYALFPSAINILLFLNYAISLPAGSETYKFHAAKERVQSGLSRYSGNTTVQYTSRIILENDAYENYLGIRIFSSIDKFTGKTKITYHFKRGMLGIRRISDYKFE